MRTDALPKCGSRLPALLHEPARFPSSTSRLAALPRALLRLRRRRACRAAGDARAWCAGSEVGAPAGANRSLATRSTDSDGTNRGLAIRGVDLVGTDRDILV
jgi:hypothetical protein